MFMLSKLKEAVSGRSTKSEPVKGKDVECEEGRKDGKSKSEVEELLQQCSEFEEMDTQDFTDSPILFPSQNSCNKEKRAESDEESDCYEVVERTDFKEEKGTKNPKNRSRLSLSRKRQVTEEAGQGFESTTNNGSTSSKQRRMVNENNVASVEPVISAPEPEEAHLKRLYKKPSCNTLEEGDRYNLYYAPRHVNANLYTAVISRKFEVYRRRLRRAQANLRPSWSRRRRRRFKAVELTCEQSRDRAGRRVKGARVVKKSSLEWKYRAERKMADDPFVSACQDIWLSLKAKETDAKVVNIELEEPSLDDSDTKDERENNSKDVASVKVASTKKSVPVPETAAKTTKGSSSCETTSKTTIPTAVSSTTDIAIETNVGDDAANTLSDHAAMETASDDIAVETVNNDATSETSNNDVTMTAVNSCLDMKTGSTSVASETLGSDVTMISVDSSPSTTANSSVAMEPTSPVKLVLDEKYRTNLLKDLNSEDDLQNFNFRCPPAPAEGNKIEEADCVLVEAVSSPTTVTMEKSRKKEPECIECPMCYKDFPKDRIQEHAYLCNGLVEASTSTGSVSTSKDENLAAGVAGAQVMTLSPVIKTRTPTKVKELKLLVNLEKKSKDIIKRNSTGGITTSGDEQKTNKRRISLEPSIRLRSLGVSGVKCGESLTKGQQTRIEEDEENKLSPRKDLKEKEQRKRLSISNTRRNLYKKQWDVSTLKRDFIPLEFEKSNEKIPSNDVHKVLSMMDASNFESSSSDEDLDLDLKKPVASKRKTGDVQDDMDALSMLANEYKGRKRKNNRENTRKTEKKLKVLSNEEHCSICGNDIPRSQYAEHVAEEIRQLNENDDKVNLSMSSSPQNTQSDVAATDIVDRRSSDSRLSLPDLAEGTTCLETGDDDDSASDDDGQFSLRQKEGQLSRGSKRLQRGAQLARRRQRRIRR
ncbi:uncharacterized protein LOC114516214 isoform X2 [Dendronephthya gigantea]|uniref:uncharacterized protein LOC114516214 isoform X2 n=1 Tax=Dendronephthya gigantea TaxID=151771 RepID=UPI00106C943C|nr:uncharacterized protein LOC114516214 isoform X2 [Dendronephthya gigantea]